MELVAESKKPKSEVLDESREMLREAYALLTSNTAGVKETLTGALDRQHFVGPCPKCGGALRLARSPRGSRWVQCSNNPATCPVTLSLPAARFIEPAPEFLCATCKTPRVKIVFRGQRPELYCINPECAEHHKAFRIGTCPNSGDRLESATRSRASGSSDARDIPLAGPRTRCPSAGSSRRTSLPARCARRRSSPRSRPDSPPWTLCINPKCPTRISRRRRRPPRRPRRSPAAPKKARAAPAEKAAAPAPEAIPAAPSPLPRPPRRRPADVPERRRARAGPGTNGATAAPR